MEEMVASLSEASVTLLCLDQFQMHDWSGRFYVRSRVKPYYFQGTLELLEIMEQFYDWIDYPQASLISRSFRQAPQRKTINSKQKRELGMKEKVNRKGEQIVVLSEREMKQNCGEKATFLVRVQYRQRATWQGQITWAEKNKTVSFRSALELLKLIDSVNNSDIVSFEELSDAGEMKAHSETS